jgi:hypothetical protein
MGWARAFVCDIENTCARPNCVNLEHPEDQSTGPAYEVLVSLSNLNHVKDINHLRLQKELLTHSLGSFRPSERAEHGP